MSSTPTSSHRHTQSAPKAHPVAAATHIPTNPYFANIKACAKNSQSELENLPPPTTPPRTPQKNDYDTSTSNGRAGARADSAKSKSKGKNRQKNAVTSPTDSRKGTPSSIGMKSTSMSTSVRPVSTPSTSAYAGPTFHASPAPSALPIPTFSRSVLDSPSTKDTMMLNKSDSSSSSDDSPTPPAALISPSLTQQESPLDFIFKADREEKARVRSAGLRRMTRGSSPFSPFSDSSQNNNDTSTSTSQGRNRATHFIGGPSSAMFAMELDGTNSPGKPLGPAFSTPYNERINAAKYRSASTLSSQTNREQLSSKDRSEALKSYLFSRQTPSSPSTRPSAPSDVVSNMLAHTPASTATRSRFAPDARQANSSIYHSRQNSSPLPAAFISEQSCKESPCSPSLRQEISPTITHSLAREQKGYSSSTTGTPPRPQNGCNTPMVPVAHDSNFTPNHSTSYNSCSASSSHVTDIKGMEDSLRRILKIDPVGGSGVHSSGLGNIPVGVITVPNYNQ